MNKLRYIFLSFLSVAFFIKTEKFETQTMRSKKVIAANLYKTITETNLKNGLILDKPGSYILAGPTTVPSSGSNQEAATIKTINRTNGVIIIAANNVTLNLNGYSIKTNKDNLVAIYVNDGVSGTIIENGSLSPGSESWLSGIVVGESCVDVTIKNITVSGCVDGDTPYTAIAILGSSATDTRSQCIKIENVNIFDTLTDGALTCSYIDSLELINVHTNNAIVTGTHDAMYLNNCNDVSLKNIQVNSNTTTSGYIKGLSLISCTDLSLHTVSVSNNTSSTGGTFDGIYITDCKNITGSDISTNSNNSIGNSNGINILGDSNTIHLKNISTSNNSSSASGSICIGLNIQSTKNFSAKNVQSNNNSGNSSSISTLSTYGLQFTDCKDIQLTNIITSNNSNNFTGRTTTGISIIGCNNLSVDHFEAHNLANAKSAIDFTTSVSNNIEFYNVSISNCTSGAGTLKVILLEEGVNNFKLTNCLISNNTATGVCHGVFVENESTNLSFDNVEIISNASLTNGNFNGFNLTNTINNVEIKNCKVEHNSLNNGSFFGIQTSGDVKNLYVSNSSFSNNFNTSSTATGKIMAGVYMIGNSNQDNGLLIENCRVNNNSGAGQICGFYIEKINSALIKNCTANGNTAATKTTGTLPNQGIDNTPTAGFYLWKCNYCTVENCSAINNRAGNHAPNIANGATDIITLTSSCSGFGFMNIGDSNTTKSIGNNYKNCVANGNTTQHSSVAATVSGITGYAATGVTTTANYGKRYYQSGALAGGFAAQLSQGTEFYNCTANNNGDNPFVISYGFLVVNNSTSSQCKQINITKCTANNNQYFGFVDSGVHQNTQVNSETTLFANYAAMNGEHNLMLVGASGTEFNPVGSAVAGGVMDGHFRNYWLYFSDAGQDIPIKKISYGGQGMAQIPGNELFNISMAKDA